MKNICECMDGHAYNSKAIGLNLKKRSMSGKHIIHKLFYKCERTNMTVKCEIFRTVA